MAARFSVMLNGLNHEKIAELCGNKLLNDASNFDQLTAEHVPAIYEHVERFNGYS